MSLLFKGKGRVQEGQEVRHQTEDSNPGVGRRAMSQTETGIKLEHDILFVYVTMYDRAVTWQ